MYRLNLSIFCFVVVVVVVAVASAATLSAASSSSSSVTRLRKISHFKIPGRPMTAAVWHSSSSSSAASSNSQIPSPLVAVGAEGGTIFLFHAPPKGNATKLLELRGHTHVNALSFSIDGRQLVSASTTDEVAMLWKLSENDKKLTAATSQKIPLHAEGYEATFSDGDLYAIGDGDGKIVIFSNDEKKKKPSEMKMMAGAHKSLVGAARIGSDSFVRQISFSKNSNGETKILAVSGDFNLFVFDTLGRPDENGIGVFDRTRKCRTARFSPDGKTLCCGERNRGTVYCETVDGSGSGGPELEEAARKINHGEHVFGLDFLSDDVIVSVGADRTLMASSGSGAARTTKIKGDNAVVSQDRKSVVTYSMFQNVVEVFEVTTDPEDATEEAELEDL